MVSSRVSSYKGVRCKKTGIPGGQSTVRRNCESQKLNPGRNRRVRCHQARQYQVRRKMKRCNLKSADQHAAPNAEPMPDSDATRRTRISTNPGELKEEVPKRLRIVTKQSRPLWMATDTVSEQPEKRARIPETHAEVDPETFALTLESRGTMKTYTELNVAASDLHESDLEEVWSNDLGWFQSPICRQLVRKRSRSCESLTHSKRFCKMRLREISSAHGLLTNGTRVEN